MHSGSLDLSSTQKFTRLNTGWFYTNYNFSSTMYQPPSPSKYDESQKANDLVVGHLARERLESYISSAANNEYIGGQF